MLSTILTSDQKVQIDTALARLFMFQGKKAEAWEISQWANEIQKWGYPLEVVLIAIAKLNDYDSLKFKLSSIKNACSDQMTSERENENTVIPKNRKCQFCNDSGMVSMLSDSTKTSYGFACICETGDRKENHIMPTWNGQERQNFKNENYSFWLPEILNIKNTNQFP